MPPDPIPELDARLAAATPQDTVRGIMFNALFDVVRERGSDALARRIDPEGTARRRDFLAYSVDSYLRIAWAGADALPHRFDDTLFTFGHRGCAGVLGSRLGRTLIAFAGTDPALLLRQASVAYRGTVSYGERTLEWPGERHARFTFRRDFLVPPFHCGVFTAALEACGAKGIRVTGREAGFLEAVYELRWE